MSFQQRDYGSEKLIINSVIGYRQWYYSDNELFSNRDTVWTDRSLVAECKAYVYDEDIPPDHEAPLAECTCGIYAHYLPLESYSRGAANVFGVVRASGKILMGTKGFRAEKVEIVALGGLGVCNSWFQNTSPTPYEKNLESLIDFCTKIGVPYFPSVGHMTDEFPQDDLESLGVPSLDDWIIDRHRSKQEEQMKLKAMEERHRKAYLDEQELLRISGMHTASKYLQGRYLDTFKALGGF